MASLRKELISAIASSKNADDQERSRIEDAKCQFSTLRSATTHEFTLARKYLYTFQIERNRLTAQVYVPIVEHDRIKLDKDDRDADRDRLVQEVAELRTERDQALHSKYFLFALLSD